jgi:hypothetical protein
MRKSAVRLYGPFLALIVVQALIMSLAPSTPRDSEQVAAFDPGGGSGVGGGPGGGGFSTDGVPLDDLGVELGADGQPAAGLGAAGGGGGGDGSGPGGTGGGPGGGSGGGAGAAGAGDTSHCVGDRQFDVLLNNPECRPRWSGDNGGATYRGVSADKVRVVVFREQSNAAVNAVLAPQGLAATEEELDALYAAAMEFIQANYELYGREIELIRVTGDCPQTPPDPAKCIQAARQVIALEPFMVIWQTPLYAEVFDEWTRAQIISIGGWHFENSYFTRRRPFRYDVFMDGTQSAEHIAEYYCKKMANGPATHAARVIHPTIGGRDTARRLGIVVPEIEANVATARIVQQRVAQCSNGPDPVLLTYESNIETAQTQTTNTTLALINAKVTTVVCMCDPIAPAFQTTGFAQQSYYPEYLLPGLGLIDYDLLGRLYNPQVMQHAFGPSHLQTMIPFEQQDQSRMWRAAGRPGVPCKSCGLPWAYLSLMASILHHTGPNLTPLTVEQTVLSLPPTDSSKPGTVRIQFGRDDYTALSDVKEVRWCGSCQSVIDGRPGAYVPLDEGRRYQLGQWPAGLSVPVGS